MRTQTAVAHFGKKFRLAQLLKPTWSVGAVYMWGDVVPLAAARKIHELSHGEVPIVESFYDEKGNILSEYVPPRKSKPVRKKKRRA